jgi:SAM-dependent methyltransferase
MSPVSTLSHIPSLMNIFKKKYFRLSVEFLFVTSGDLKEVLSCSSSLSRSQCRTRCELNTSGNVCGVQVRCQFVRSAVCDHFGLITDVPEPFAGLKMLDVGCGGGLLCEPLARMGAEVTGVDVVAHSIQIASAHAQR